MVHLVMVIQRGKVRDKQQNNGFFLLEWGCVGSWSSTLNSLSGRMNCSRGDTIVIVSVKHCLKELYWSLWKYDVAKGLRYGPVKRV